MNIEIMNIAGIGIDLPQTITVEYRRRKETRTIVKYIYNSNRNQVIAWESDTTSGVCMLDVWKKWCVTGVDKL